MHMDKPATRVAIILLVLWALSLVSSHTRGGDIHDLLILAVIVLLVRLSALVVLAAMLVGAAIPVLVQLRATLRAMERTVQRSDPRPDGLSVRPAAAGRIDALVVRLEERGRLQQLVDGITAMSRMVSQLRDTVRVASAVGAAISSHPT
jgi:hypothetical protein